MEIDSYLGFKQLNFPEIIKIGILFMIKVLQKIFLKGLEQSLTFFFLDWNGSFLSSKFPDVCCVWFGSISVTANMWHGLQAVWDLDVPKVCIASPHSQALCYKTGLLPSLFSVLSSCIVCCSICISCCLCSVSCRLTKWEGFCLIHSWVFTVWVLECTLQPS